MLLANLRHDDFKDSAYIYVGGIPYELTEGDIICVFSQYGEILDMNMPRDRETGKPKGFCFLKYDDQRSTVLAVDNFNGAQLLGRTLRVDHSRDYRQRTKRKKKHSDSESEESEVELDEEGKPRVKGFNVAPKGWLDPPVEVQSESDDDSLAEGIDPEDPMRDYLIEKRREEREGGKKDKKHRHQKIKDEEENGTERRHRHRHRSSHHSHKDGEDKHRHRHHRHRDRDGNRIESSDRRQRELHGASGRKRASPQPRKDEDNTPPAHDRTPERRSREERDDTPE